jgi:hypothetical protein
MVAAAREAGLGAVSARLVTDWESKGLLDRPERKSHGKGGGRGAAYVWPDNQRDLFLTLLAKRSSVKSIAGLCVIPVGIWLYWGDDWVPLRQVKVALQTWWKRAGRTGWDDTLDSARLVVKTMAPPGTPRAITTELRELIAGALEEGVFPREAITELIQQLLDRGPGNGEYGRFSQRSNEIVDGMWSMVVAMQHYDEVTDGMFYEARARLKPIILNYARDWPELSLDPLYGKSFEHPTWEFLINRSCSQLLVGLGLQLHAIEDGRSLGPIEIGNSIPFNKVLSATGGTPTASAHRRIVAPGAVGAARGLGPRRRSSMDVQKASSAQAVVAESATTATFNRDAENPAICVVDGYGIRVATRAGRLIVSDGMGHQRRERIYNRATHGLSRLVVMATTGHITVEAYRWLDGAGVGLMMLDPEFRGRHLCHHKDCQ